VGTDSFDDADADPLGRSLGRFFADEVAKPLGLDFHIGLPASVDRDRVAQLHSWSHAEMMLHPNVLPVRFLAATFNPRSLTLRAVTIKGMSAFDDNNRDDVPRRRDTRLERHRYRAVGGQSLRIGGPGPSTQGEDTTISALRSRSGGGWAESATSTRHEPVMIHCRACSICPAGKCLISADTKCDVKCSATSPKWESVTTAIRFMRL